MGLFRRREPLHEQLARKAGLFAELREEPLDPRPPTLVTGIHGVQRPRAWDATLTADVEGIDADEVSFVALPDSTLLVEDGPPSAEDGVPRPGGGGLPAHASSHATLDPLAEAVEREVRPPYRARAVRRGQALWAVQVRRIEVLALPGASGDALDLTRTPEDGAELRVDGERVVGTVPALEQRGEREGRSFAVHAERLDGDLWEVRASAL